MDGNAQLAEGERAKREQKIARAREKSVKQFLAANFPYPHYKWCGIPIKAGPTERPLDYLFACACPGIMFGAECIVYQVGGGLVTQQCRTLVREYVLADVILDDRPPVWIWYNAGERGIVTTNSVEFKQELESEKYREPVDSCAGPTEWIRAVHLIDSRVPAK